MIFLKNQYIQCNDVNISYTENGDGEAIIFLHGNSGGKETFLKYQKEYFKHYHTFALDSRGHGKSKSSNVNFSIDQFSEDVITFCNLKNIKEAYVVGHSDGGNIGLLLAHKRPDIFKKVVAISPNYLVSGTKQWFLNIINCMLKVFKLFKRVGFNTEKFINITMLMLRDIGISKNDLMNIKTSVFVIYAEKDLIKEEHIEEINSLIPNCKIEKIKKSNHLSVVFKKQTIGEIEKYFRE